MKRFVTTFLLVLLSMTVFCGGLIYVTSRHYVQVQRNSARPLTLLLLAAVALGATCIIAHEFRPGLGRKVARARLPFVLVCALVGAAGPWAYAWRPENNQALATARDRTEWLRAEWTWSMRWLVEWLGFAAVVVAIGGLLMLFRRALRGSVTATAVVVLAVPLTIIYLWTPRVAVDQPWAMRRFMPVVIPGLAIGAVALLQSLTGVARRSRERRVRVPALLSVGLLTVATFAPSAFAAAPLVEARAQHGALSAVRTLCDALPRDAAVVLYRASYLDGQMTQTIRGFCEVPTARAPIGENLDVSSLARAWRTTGRSLFIITTSPEQIENETSANVRVVLHLEIDDRYAPEHTYRVRPRRFEPQPRQLWLMQVGPSR